MPEVTADITLRPVKFAFLLESEDKASLLKIIEVNSFLWGGIYNPIIPTFVPDRWSETVRTPQDLLDGFLQTYDPDIIVTSSDEGPSLSVGDHKTVSLSKIIAGIEDNGIGSYGISIFELLNHFIETEIKFVRREPLDFCLTSFLNPSDIFMASVFGTLSKSVYDLLTSNYAVFIGQEITSLPGADYLKLLNPNTLFLRRLTSLYVEQGPGRLWGGDDCILVLDSEEILDVIEYWNLRALGWTVIPLTKAVLKHKDALELAREFIEANYQPFRANPQIYNQTTVVKCSSLSMFEFDAFIESLLIPSTTNSNQQRISVWKYPPIWNDAHRKEHRIDCCELKAESSTTELVTTRERISIRTLDPVFINKEALFGVARFANCIALRLFSDTDLYAEVIPQGGPPLVDAIGGMPFEHWRFSRSGIVYISAFHQSPIHLSVPHAEGFVRQWLNSKGWKAELSDKGLIAKQVLKRVGLWGLSILADVELIGILRRYGEGKVVNENTLRNELTRVVTKKGRGGSVEGLLRSLVDHEIFRLGLEMQCTVCRQRSWYSLSDAKYELRCTKCLETFSLRGYLSKDFTWAYRSFGPFSLPNQSYGVISVLLTLRFFSLLLRASTTPMLSMSASKDNTNIEVDLCLLLREDAMLRSRSNKMEVVFVECKTLNLFEPRDIERMKLIGDHFPGAILAFSTLREQLLEEEKALIIPLVEHSRRNRAMRKPFNQILILTSVEILGLGGPPVSWRLKGGKYSLLASADGDLDSICDATQQMHLGMESYITKGPI